MRRGFLGHGVLVITALASAALAGCEGKPTTGMQSVAAAEIIGVVPPCAAGSAHPNVCCREGTCVMSSPAAPFDACPAGALLFPDRRLCCPLGGGDCVAAPSGDGGAVNPSSACTLPCGPEGYAVAAPDSACGTAPSSDPSAGCFYCCTGLGCYANVCSCPPSGPCPCGVTCDPCPIDWSTPSAQVDLCCASPTRCFSQSAAVQAPGGGGTFSGPDGCEAVSTSGGQLYDLTCDAKTSSCACTFDGTMTKQFTFASGAACDLASCGFPH